MESNRITPIESSGILLAVASRFKPQESVLQVDKYGNGNINDTFLVTLDSETERRFVLQRINTRVFRRPDLVMSNLRVCSEHIHKKLSQISLTPNRRWEMPRVLVTAEGQDHWIGSDDSFWRAISFIDSSQSYDTVMGNDHAMEVGYGLGMFHKLISDLPIARLADTLEGFHITPRYLQHYEWVKSNASTRTSPEVGYCLRFIDERSAWASILENARAQGRLPLRPIHGDPKVNNIMIDAISGKAIAMVDLDTVKPGLVHYDIGDCLRSCCNPLGEETDLWDLVRFETELCLAILKGYLSLVSDFLASADYEYLYDAIRLIAFELGLRFFTDYLEGDVYFKTTSEEHNLARAVVQFKLTESIELQEIAIRSIIKDLR